MQDYPDQFDEAAPASAPASLVSPRRFLVASRRHWWIPVLAALLAAGAAFLVLWKQPVQYVSKSTMWVRGKLRLSDVGQYTEDLQNFFGTQIQLLQSDRMQERTVARLTSTHPDLGQFKDEAGRLRVPKLKVGQAPKSAVFTLEAYSSSAAYAKAYLDALMDEFLSYKKEVRTATSGDALASVSAQVYKQETELKQEQEKLTQFQRENNVALLDETLRGGGAQLAQLNAQVALLQLELQLMEATAIEKKAGAPGWTNSLSALPGVAAVSGVSSGHAMASEFFSAQQKMELLLNERDELSVHLRPKHPKIIKLNDEITRVERVIEFFRTQNQGQINAAQQAAKIRLASLESSAKDLAEKVGDANRRLAERERLHTAIARQQSFYDRLLALLQGVDLNSSMNQEDVAILERAGDGLPPKTKTPAIVGAAGGAGLFLGLGIIFLIARRDDRSDSLVELQTRFTENVFGQVPDVEITGGNGHLPVLQLDDPRYVFAESCRNLRSSLLFGRVEGPRPKAILVTSAVPDEGKSTISLNLASALAMGGARVLLVDGDIRRGRLHKLLDVVGDPGLAECVKDSGDVTRFARPTSLPNLFVLPRGKAADALGELFLAPGFDLLMQHARAQFDYIVVDSVPVFAADAATTLAPKMDGVLFIVRRGYTSARMAQEALELLYQRQAKVMGIIFNRVNSRAKDYKYYKYTQYYPAQPTA